MECVHVKHLFCTTMFWSGLIYESYPVGRSLTTPTHVRVLLAYWKCLSSDFRLFGKKQSIDMLRIVFMDKLSVEWRLRHKSVRTFYHRFNVTSAHPQHISF